MAYYAVTVSAPGASTGTTSYYTQTASGGLGRRVGGRHRSYRGGGGGSSWKRAPPKYKAPKGAESWGKVLEYFSGPALDKALTEHPTVGKLGEGWGGGLFGVTTTPRGKGVSGPDPTRYVTFQTTAQKAKAKEIAAKFRAEQTALAQAKAQARQTWGPTKPTTFKEHWPSKQAYLDWRAQQLATARQEGMVMRRAAESISFQPKYTKRQMGRGRGALPARLRVPRMRQQRAALKRYRQRELLKVKAHEQAVNLWETETKA